MAEPLPGCAYPAGLRAGDGQLQGCPLVLGSMRLLGSLWLQKEPRYAGDLGTQHHLPTCLSIPPGSLLPKQSGRSCQRLLLTPSCSWGLSAALDIFFLKG